MLTGALPGTVSGNILDNGDAFGADGEGYILSLQIGAVTYTYDPDTNTIPNNVDATVINGSTLTRGTPEGGQIVFHFADPGSFDAGDFSYVSPANVASAFNIGKAGVVFGTNLIPEGRGDRFRHLANFGTTLGQITVPREPKPSCVILEHALKISGLTLW